MYAGLLSCCFLTAKLKQIIQEINKSSTYAPGPCHVHVIVSCNKPKTLLDRLKQLQQMKLLKTECLILFNRSWFWFIWFIISPNNSFSQCQNFLFVCFPPPPTASWTMPWIWYPNMMVQIPSEAIRKLHCTRHWTLFIITSLQQNQPL